MFPDPWRIVLPASIFFAIMSGCSVAHFCLLLGKFDDVCVQLRIAYERTHPGPRLDARRALRCRYLLEQFAARNDVLVPIGANYYMGNAFSGVAAFLWTLALCMMCARVLLVSDFQLIQVSVATIERRTGKTTKLASGTVEIVEWRVNKNE